MSADLRRTKCNFGDIRRPFRVAERQDTFKLSMHDILASLNSSNKDFFACDKPQIISIWEDLVQEERNSSESKPTTHRSAHNSFVVLPPSEGTSKSMNLARIQVGNVDELEERQRREEIEIRRRHNEERTTPDWDNDVFRECFDGCSCCHYDSDDEMLDSGYDYWDSYQEDQGTRFLRQHLVGRSFDILTQPILTSADASYSTEQYAQC